MDDMITVIQDSTKISQNQIAIATAINHHYKIDPKDTYIVYTQDSAMYAMDLIKLLAFSVKIFNEVNLPTNYRLIHIVYSESDRYYIHNSSDDVNEVYIVKKTTNKSYNGVNNIYINLIHPNPELISGYGKPDKNGEYMNTSFLYID